MLGASDLRPLCEGLPAGAATLGLDALETARWGIAPRKELLVRGPLSIALAHLAQGLPCLVARLLCSRLGSQRIGHTANPASIPHPVRMRRLASIAYPVNVSWHGSVHACSPGPDKVSDRLGLTQASGHRRHARCRRLARLARGQVAVHAGQRDQCRVLAVRQQPARRCRASGCQRCCATVPSPGC